jgi:ribosomal protein S18 acetylase RimI-like enzyme
LSSASPTSTAASSPTSTSIRLRKNRGIGAALLDHAKALRPEGLELWAFQKNVGARRFYERHGFRLVRLTDGAENMEREPDALYEWRAT